MAGASAISYSNRRKEETLNNQEEYVAFLKDVAEHVEHYYEGQVKGEVVTSIKNNQVAVTGLLLKGADKQIAPSFYLENQFVDWMQGKLTMGEVLNGLYRVYEEELEKNCHLAQEISFEWQNFRERVFPKLINREKNQDILREIPYQEFLDLAVVYYYTVSISEGIVGTMMIKLEHMGVLGITMEELHEAAISNYHNNQSVRFRSMDDILLNLGGKFGMTLEVLRERPVYMCVLTNSRGLYGAVSLYFKGELAWFARQVGRSFYVLPSSIHEVILVPEYDSVSVEYFSQMVKEINETQVDATEVLSDSVYYYDIKMDELRRVG